MAFQNDYNIPTIEDSTLNGIRIPIAVMSWTTTNCKVIPLILKIQDNDGVVHTVKSIHVCYNEKKKYYGQWCWVFDCRTTEPYCPSVFRLIYYTEDVKWEMVI